MEYLNQLMFGLLIALLVREIVGYLSRFSYWVVRAAARRLPTEERERFIEENLAVLDNIEGPLYKLYNALGCLSAAASLINEHAVASGNPAIASAIQKPESPLNPGQSVTIDGGPFDGLAGQILEIRESDRVLLLLNILNQQTRVLIETKMLR
jgi:transcription antitermination factor NusG